MQSIAWTLYCLGSPSTVGSPVFSVATVVVPPEVGGYVPSVSSSKEGVGGGVVSSSKEGVGGGVVTSDSSIGGSGSG